MTRQTLLDIDNRRPFERYLLRFKNGGVIRIEQPEHCLVTEDGRTDVFNESGGKLKLAILSLAPGVTGAPFVVPAFAGFCALAG